jgi:GNAT superfamily N-acetyltransferase
MIITNDEGLAPFTASLDNLYRDCFDGLRFCESDHAEVRSVLSAGHDVISHAAIKQCTYNFISDSGVATWILGYVCTDREFRGRGHASQCLLELFDALQSQAWIMVLNCKRTVAGFYEKCGFEIIADKASYDRNGKISIDDDPVMAKCSTPELKTAIVRNTILHLGEEF